MNAWPGVMKIVNREFPMRRQLADCDLVSDWSFSVTEGSSSFASGLGRGRDSGDVLMAGASMEALVLFCLFAEQRCWVVCLRVSVEVDRLGFHTLGILG